jgi:hypothetical protein
LALAPGFVVGTPSARGGNVIPFTNFDGPLDDTQGTTVDGINNEGQVVGFNTGAIGGFANFIRNVDGSFTILNFANSSTAMANGLNSGDQVVGGSGRTRSS